MPELHDHHLRVAAQLRDPLALLLLAASAVSLAVWVLEGSEGFPFETVVIA